MTREAKNRGSGTRTRGRKTLVLLAVIAVLAAVGVLASRHIGRSFSSLTLAFDVEGFVGSQLKGIVNSHLRPELSFTTIAYEAPGTVRLDGVTLVTPEGITILDARALTVTLAEVPRRDRPIKIERVALERGVVRLVDDGDGGFAGFSRMTEGTPRGEEVEEEFRLSNVLVLRRVVLDGIDIEYLGADGSPPIRLDGLSASMDVEPDPADGPGWYELAFDSGRSPGLTLDVAGRLNLDTFDTVVDSLHARIDASPETIGSLPGPLASLLESYEIRGRLGATGSGTLNLRDPASGTATLAVRGDDLNVAFGEYRAPVEALSIESKLLGGVLSIQPASASLHSGSVRAGADIDLTSTGRPTRGEWRVEGIDLSEFLRSRPSEGAPPRLAGIVTGSGTVSTSLATLNESLSGEGEVRIENGRLVMLPGLTLLSDLINRGSRASGDASSNHRATARFSLQPGGARISESEVVTNTIAARGTGFVGFDRTLDLRVNAGPLEKLQSMLGPIGNLLGRVTDRLVTYTIRGTFDDPRVRVAPLGID